MNDTIRKLTEELKQVDARIEEAEKETAAGTQAPQAQAPYFQAQPPYETTLTGLQMKRELVYGSLNLAKYEAEEKRVSAKKEALHILDRFAGDAMQSLIWRGAFLDQGEDTREFVAAEAYDQAISMMQMRAKIHEDYSDRDFGIPEASK